MADRQRTKCVFVLAALLLVAAGPARTEDTGVLQLVGGLHCATAPASAPGATAELSCELRLMAPEAARLDLRGRMTGSGLPLLAPGDIRLFWNVYAPTGWLEPIAVLGRYDTSSRHGFKIADQSDRALVGGMNDSVLLELVAPRIDPIRTDTRLDLDLAPPG